MQLPVTSPQRNALNLAVQEQQNLTYLCAQGCLLPLSATKGTATHAPTYTVSTDCNPNERILQRLVWRVVRLFF